MREEINDLIAQADALTAKMAVTIQFVQWVLEQPDRAACFDDPEQLTTADMQRIMETCDDT